MELRSLRKAKFKRTFARPLRAVGMLTWVVNLQEGSTECNTIQTYLMKEFRAQFCAVQKGVANVFSFSKISYIHSFIETYYLVPRNIPSVGDTTVKKDIVKFHASDTYSQMKGKILNR